MRALIPFLALIALPTSAVAQPAPVTAADALAASAPISGSPATACC